MNPNFKRIIKKEHIHSQALGETKEVIISFPPGYHNDQAYPVLLLHDGDDYIRMGRIVTQANPLIDSGQLQPFFIVGLPVKKKQRNQEYSPIGKSQSAHMQFVIEELLPFLATNFPADCSKEQLVIGGSSLGGTISLHLALTYPEHCQRVLSQSGAFLKPTIEQIEQTDSLAHLHIYQSIGLGETAVPTHVGQFDLVTSNREVHRKLVEKEAKVNYIEAAGEHTWRLWQQDLPQALHHFFAPS